MSQFGPLSIGEEFDHDDEVLLGDASGDIALGYATRADVEALHGHLTTLLGYDVADDTTEEGVEYDYTEPALDSSRVQALAIATTLVGNLTTRSNGVDEVLNAASWLLDEETSDYEFTPTHDPDAPAVLPDGVTPLFRPHEA